MSTNVSRSGVLLAPIRRHVFLEREQSEELPSDKGPACCPSWRALLLSIHIEAILVGSSIKAPLPKLPAKCQTPIVSSGGERKCCPRVVNGPKFLKISRGG